LDLDSLNEPQREAVEHGDGPLLVFAGAGSGKTRVLTYRLAHLIESGRARPYEILAVTFTNKAAAEMKRRVDQLVHGGARGAWVHTFHSACLRMLRRDGEHIGLQRDFVIYDDGDQRALLRNVLKRVDRSGRITVGQVRARIEEAKRSRIPPSEFDAGPAFGPALREAYAAYERQLRAANAVDFTDLLALAARLLEEAPDVLERYRDRFRHLLVDEFQDTDEIQYDVVRLLAAPHDNLCAVGDDDQSIYSFRGADVGNIRTFHEDFPEARVVRLEQNYRSTTAILDAATRVVNGGGGGRTPKHLWTDRGDGVVPTVTQARDEPDEAHRVVGAVRRELAAGVQADDVAVLFRTNAQSRHLEEAFNRSGIPFVLIGGTRFYERREIKEALSWLRLLVQPADLISFSRAVRAPTRGIGPATVAKVVARAVEHGENVHEAIGAMVAARAVGPALCKRLEGFDAVVRRLRGEAESQPLPDIVERVLERSGLAASYADEGGHEGQARVDNLLELVRSTAEGPYGQGLAAIAEFMDRSALVADADSLPDGAGTDLTAGRDEPRVNLMTIHCAKGLEFPVVCLVGLDEGMFPNSRAAADQHGLEEEYRLCYVACTRAMDRLHLFRARRRMMVFQGGGGGRGSAGWRQTRPSPFLRFLAAQHPPTGRPSWTPSVDRASEPEEDEDDDSVVVYDPGEVELRVGLRVRHPTFGVGEIRRIEGSPVNLRLEVFFRAVGPKLLSARHARLEIIGS